MASGSSPGRGPYGAQIDKALQYVMDNTAPSGFVAVAVGRLQRARCTAHGFGTLFLAEAYGMTHRPEIREKLEKAVRLIIDTQNGEGGWRYQPVRADADLSVTICQINALRAARNAGHLRAQGDGRGLHPVRQAVARTPTAGSATCSTAAAAPSRGRRRGWWRCTRAAVYDAKEVDAGITYLKNHIARDPAAAGRNGHYFYGHYYAAQAMWIRGGEDWNAVVSRRSATS